MAAVNRSAAWLFVALEVSVSIGASSGMSKLKVSGDTYPYIPRSAPKLDIASKRSRLPAHSTLTVNTSDRRHRDSRLQDLVLRECKVRKEVWVVGVGRVALSRGWFLPIGHPFQPLGLEKRESCKNSFPRPPFSHVSAALDLLRRRETGDDNIVLEGKHVLQGLLLPRSCVGQCNSHYV
jgi:hypothetical protein